jgi:predicted glutamine amidotransferase
MCRLLGVVSSESTDYGFSLREAPRSLATLSREHPHGWGLAVHDASRGWDVLRHASCAGDDARFGEAASRARGRVLVAHVRKATVGATSLANTHPFRRGAWVFAHNGTIVDTSWLEQRTSPERAREIEGETDSERFFAYLLTVLDDLGATGGSGDQVAAVDRALAAALAAMVARPGFGAINFLLSDGAVLYAHRLGRTLFVLERGRGDAVRPSRPLPDTGAVLETPWSSRRIAVLLASERISDEPWEELPEGALVRVDRTEHPSWTTLEVGGAERAPAARRPEPAAPSIQG